MCLKYVLAFWTLCQVLKRAWSEAELSPPLDVRVDSAVHWSPATDSPHIKYTVQSWISGREKWHNISGCVQTELTTCNKVSGLGCVMVHVWAQEGNRTSRAVQACSHADSCSPVVHLTSQAGRMMVQMEKNNRLFEDYGDHFQYKVNYGRDGEELKSHDYFRSSTTIQGLDVGQSYCVQVQYFCYKEPFGIPSAVQCVSIPESEMTRQTRIVAVGVTLTILLGGLVVGLASFIYRHHKNIKQFLQPQLRIPDHYFEFLSGASPKQALSLTTSPCEERHDLISLVCREEEPDREQDYNSPNGLDSFFGVLEYYE